MRVFISIMFEEAEVIRRNALCETAEAELVLPSGQLLKVACPSEVSIRNDSIFIDKKLVSSFLSTEHIF